MKKMLVTIVVGGLIGCIVGFSFSGDAVEDAMRKWPAGTVSPEARLKGGAEVFQMVFSLYLSGKMMDGKITAVPKHRLQLGVPTKGLGTTKSTMARIFAPITPEEAVAVVDYFKNGGLLSNALDIIKAPFTMDNEPTPTTYGFTLSGGKKVDYMIVVGTAPQATKSLEGLRAVFEKRASSNVVSAIDMAIGMVAKDAASQAESKP